MLFTKYCADEIEWNEGKWKRYWVCLGVGPEGRRRPGKPRPVWENNIKACVKEISWHSMD